MDAESKAILNELVEICEHQYNQYFRVGMYAPGAVYKDVADRLRNLMVTDLQGKPVIPAQIFFDGLAEQHDWAHRNDPTPPPKPRRRQREWD